MKQTELLATTSAASTLTSVPYDLGDQSNFAVQVIFSGGGGNLVGTLTLEASADDYPASNFVTVAGSSQAVAASANHVWNVQDAGYRYIRAKWTYTSGTGNVRISICAKENVVKGA